MVSVTGLWLLLSAGCATPGPLHTYSLPAGSDRSVLDLGAEGQVEVPSFLEPEDRVAGFAYDPFTDHFFIRLEPGDRIRVVDRPARAIKRELELPSRAVGGGDLAVRPRDGHLFLLAPGGIHETTRLGKFVRTIEQPPGAAPIGIAVDSGANLLLLLNADGRRVSTHQLDGTKVREISLGEKAAASLSFDPDARVLYAPLADRPNEIGLFDENGRLLKTVPGAGPFVDVGQRSLVRVF